MESDKDKNIKDSQPSVDKNLAVASYFKDNERHYFLYKKIERIVSALHLITNLLTESEPLKTAIRKKSLCLLEEASALSQANKNTLNGVIVELESLLRIARDAGYFSDMNYSIISREIEGIGSLITKYYQNYPETVFLNQSFFDVAVSLPKTHNVSPAVTIKDINYKGQNNVLYKKPLAVGVIQKDMPQPLKDLKEDRRQRIIEILRKKGICSIKDFSYVITNYSEKTIQRELGAMVLEGILRKQGEKRWSTYTLV
jgi:hypothetical protein